MTKVSKVKYGDGLRVTDEGAGVIRVDGSGGGGGGGGALEWEDVGTDTPGVSGLQFETYPQVGDWFYAEVNNRTGSPYGRAFEIRDRSTGSASGIEIRSDESEIDIDAGGQLALSANDQIDMTAFNSDVILRTTGYHSIRLDSQGPVRADALGAITLHSASQIQLMVPVSGGQVTIEDDGAGYVSSYLKIVTGASGDIEMNAPHDLVLSSAHGNLQMQNGIAQLSGAQARLVAMGSGDVQIFSSINGNVLIMGHVYGDGGVQVPLLKVTQDSLGQPTYHIKSGASWVDDL